MEQPESLTACSTSDNSIGEAHGVTMISVSNRWASMRLARPPGGATHTTLASGRRLKRQIAIKLLTANLTRDERAKQRFRQRFQSVLRRRELRQRSPEVGNWATIKNSYDLRLSGVLRCQPEQASGNPGYGRQPQPCGSHPRGSTNYGNLSSCIARSDISVFLSGRLRVYFCLCCDAGHKKPERP